MTGPAQPYYFQRLVVVGRMHLSLGCCALYTGFTLYLASTQIHMGVTSAVILAPLLICHGRVFPVLPHTCGVTGFTVPLIGASEVSTFTFFHCSTVTGVDVEQKCFGPN